MQPTWELLSTRLVVSLPLDPVSGRQRTKDELAGLVVDQDEGGEGQGRQPPLELQRVHPETFVHAGRVREDGSEDGLEN